MGKLFNQNFSAVVVGCARSCDPFLDEVLRNVGNLAKLYGRVGFIFVENDSDDNTPTILRTWLERHRCSHFISLDGLAVRESRRSARLAIARNAYMDVLKTTGLNKFDHLVVLDFDDVNTSRIPCERFIDAITYLEENEQNAGVFANQLPYYDIWALRHETWCPGDCWSEVNERPMYLPRHRAVERYFQKRQITIEPNSPPIPVRSAFGGLAIYKMPFVQSAPYVGVLSDGSEVCEHVAFNEHIVRAGGRLYIFPKLLNRAPRAHVSYPLKGVRRYLADVDPRSYKAYAKYGWLVRRGKKVCRTVLMMDRALPPSRTSK